MEVTDRVREIMESVAGVHVLATVDADDKPQMRWMGALLESPEHPWTFYLACGKSSRKMDQIAANPNAQLMFSRQTDWHVATLSGSARAVDTPEIRQLLWSGIPMMEQYYQGADDPAMGIIEFTTHCLELLAMDEAHEPYCFVLT